LMNGNRPLIITRATYAGGQRYSTIWTGDNASYDAHMILGVRLVNSLGLCGFPFAGPDIGGFIGEPSADLITRWLSIGIYTPFLRNHVAYDRNYREPWIYGKEYEKIARELINQRYRMLPYLYSVAYEATQTGMPVNRTLAIDYTFDENIFKWDFENEYLFGQNILVAPIVSTQQLAKIYLPKGKWYRLSTGKVFEGETELITEAPINDLPVFVKGGAIIPMQSVVQNTSEPNDGVLYLHLYFSNEGSRFVYYEDDGISNKFINGDFYKREILFDPVNKKIILKKKEGNYNSMFKEVHLVLHNFNEIKSMEAGKNKIYSTIEGMKLIQTISTNLTDDQMEFFWKE
jgi:alpha-glucosidase